MAFRIRNTIKKEKKEEPKKQGVENKINNDTLLEFKTLLFNTVEKKWIKKTN
jgi:hypothetical protein